MGNLVPESLKASAGVDSAQLRVACDRGKSGATQSVGGRAHRRLIDLAGVAGRELVRSKCRFI